MPIRDALRPGTRLDEFEILRVLGTGGFGIVYLARDHVLLREVAIKEYLPAALAARGEGDTVAVHARGLANMFAKGLDSFLSEARLLASFDHPSLVKVHRFWRANGTAYMAMQHYPGRTLKDARLHMPAPPDARWLDAFADDLLGVLELLHGEGVYHRDISPDNILLLDDGRPVLLDFGSARRVMVDGAQSFTAHLKPQFAPIEQYTEESGGMRQGPWTDLYALGATLYFVVTGRAPTPAVVRAVRDVLPPLASPAVTTPPNMRASLLATIDWTMALAPEQRPQDVLAVRRALRGEIAPPPPSPRQLGAPAAAAPESVAANDAVALAGRPRDTSSARPRFSRLAATFWKPGAELDAKPPLARRRSSLGLAAALGLAGMVAIGWGAWTFNRPSSAHGGTVIATGDAALANLAKALAAPAVVPPPANDPAPATASPTVPPAESPTTRTAAPAPEPPTPVDVVARSTGGDRDALAVEPASQLASGAAPDALTTAPPARSVRGSAPPQAQRAAPRDRPRAARAKAQTTSTGAQPTRTARNSCGGSGLLSGTWCAMNPCKASHAHGRANPECIERLRAEAARQQRVERQ